MAVEKKFKLPTGVVTQRVDSYSFGSGSGIVEIITNENVFGSKTAQVVIFDNREPDPLYSSRPITGGRRARRRALHAEKEKVTTTINNLNSKFGINDLFSFSGGVIQRVDSQTIRNGLGVVQVIYRDKTAQVAVYHGDDQDLIYQSELVGVGGFTNRLRARRTIRKLKQIGINEFKRSTAPISDPRVTIPGEVL